MKLKTLALSGIAASFVALPIYAMADNHRADRGNIMQRADADKDGKVSLDESLKSATDRFDSADANKDGEISLEEMVARIEQRRLERRARRMLNRMDFNGDGKVTKDEIENRAKKRFAMADRNDDGFIERSEMRQTRRQMRQERRQMRKERRGERRGENRRMRGGDEL